MAIVKSQPQQSTATFGRLLTRSLLFSDLVGAHACGVEIAVDPRELETVSDCSDDKKRAK
jgi:hypothetical protein